MRIYSVGPKDSVQRLDTDVDLRLAIMRAMAIAAPWPGDWQPARVWRLQKPRKRSVEPLGDWTSVGAAEGMPALSARAKDLLQPLLGATVQWLPLAFDEGDYWLLNCLRQPDVLDVSASTVTYRPDGTVAGIHKFAFKPGVVADEWLFKLPGAPNFVFVTDRFRELVERERLPGLFFQPVWDDAHAPFTPIPDRAEVLTRPEIYGPEGFVPNVTELWPPEWKQKAREMKRQPAGSA